MRTMLRTIDLTAIDIAAQIRVIRRGPLYRMLTVVGSTIVLQLGSAAQPEKNYSISLQRWYWLRHDQN